MARLSKSDVEAAALDWPEAIGRYIARGPGIAPGMPGDERRGCGEVVLVQPLHDTLLLCLICGELRVKDAERFIGSRAT